MGARVASLCGAVLPGKVLQEEGGWGKGGLQGHCTGGEPPWLKPCADAWVVSGGGCQGARGDPAPGQTGRQRPTLLNLHC